MDCSEPAALAAPHVRGLTKLWQGNAVEVCAPGAPLISRILAARGLTDPIASARFLEPSLRHLHDPSGMPDLDRAAERILAAARAGEPIFIYGDYDVDGVSATAILYHTLLEIAPSANIGTYVPHRLEEGYGLNSEAIRELAGRGAKVIVSVDCGVTALEPARIALAAGIDLIITDHHNPPASVDDLPRAYAVVHPRRPDSTYPFGDLCGAGVAYKLAWRLATLACGSQRVTDRLRALLIELLALASLGVIADVVPLADENRVIARFGLGRIKHSSLEGLRALVEASGLAGENIREDDVGFRLGPRLNACGRMGHAREAVELLTSARGPRAIEIAEKLTRFNDERRATEQAIFKHAAELAESSGMTRPDRRAIILSDPSWHAGVVGIVCSRLVERFHRPTILMCEGEGVCHGSGRSVEGFSLHAALMECSEHLAQFGGHDMAAGVTVKSERVPAFVESFTTIANREIPPERLIGSMTFDTDSSLDELTVPVVQQLARLGPFGRGNPPVRVRLPNLRVAMRPETFGQGNKHLSLRVKEDAPRSRVLRLVGWHWASKLDQVPLGAHIEALVSPGINTFGGGATVEGVLLDLRLLSRAERTPGPAPSA
ncbi:Single-stranded-DNA-specific exonuclease RecJ [Phycisphaerales bacterium]|nr:Single-stranded-DNA-specific exonuclease RecJ [Phycisphaerales bacterium]